MSMTVNAYLRGIPPGNKNPEKPRLLEYFIEGVNRSGDQGTIVRNFHHYDSDVAVLQGFVHPESKHVPHLDLRRAVLENQKASGKRTIIADANLFLYADPGNTKTYLRYSYDGIFPSTGEYCWDPVDGARWDQLSKDLGIQLKPWKKAKHGGNILICCQRDGGWSMNGTGIIQWLHPLILRIRRNSDRPIVVRFHPGDKKQRDHYRKISRIPYKNVTISDPRTPLMTELNNAYCMINHNSSPAVAAAIEGVPIFVLDSKNSQAADVAHNDVREIENLKTFDREPWIRKIAMSHWRLDEVKSGKAWQHMKKWANK